MKKQMILAICLLGMLFSCKKNDDDDGNNGPGDGNEGLTGRYIIKSVELCPVGSSYFLGHSLSGNLVDHGLTFTVSDTLNSWYLQKLSTGKYLIYAKLGNNFLVLKQGPSQSFLISYQVHGIAMPQMSSLPLTNTPAEMQFTITNDQNNLYTITSENGHRVTTYKGGRKTVNGVGCTYVGTPLLMNMTACIERQENADFVQYCFQTQLVLQKIN